MTHNRDAYSFTFPFRVRYAEVDAQGIVFNAHYLTYFDTAITEYLRADGFDYGAEAEKTGIDFHVVKTLVEYAAPVRFDENVDVGVRIDRVGNSSLTFELGVFGEGQSEPRVTGEVVWVYTDQASHETVRVPDRFRRLADAQN